MLKLLPREATATQAATAIHAVGHGGRVAPMEDLRAGLAIDCDWLMHREVMRRGVWMNPHSAVARQPTVLCLHRGALIA